MAVERWWKTQPALNRQPRRRAGFVCELRGSASFGEPIELTVRVRRTFTFWAGSGSRIFSAEWIRDLHERATPRHATMRVFFTSPSPNLPRTRGGDGGWNARRH